jgi:hypothetical protein
MNNFIRLADEHDAEIIANIHYLCWLVTYPPLFKISEPYFSNLSFQQFFDKWKNRLSKLSNDHHNKLSEPIVYVLSNENSEICGFISYSTKISQIEEI